MRLHVENTDTCQPTMMPMNALGYTTVLFSKQGDAPINHYHLSHLFWYILVNSSLSDVRHSSHIRSGCLR